MFETKTILGKFLLGLAVAAPLGNAALLAEDPNTPDCDLQKAVAALSSTANQTTINGAGGLPSQVSWAGVDLTEIALAST